jgi:hypothetical protein
MWTGGYQRVENSDQPIDTFDGYWLLFLVAIHLSYKISPWRMKAISSTLLKAAKKVSLTVGGRRLLLLLLDSQLERLQDYLPMDRQSSPVHTRRLGLNR